MTPKQLSAAAIKAALLNELKRQRANNPAATMYELTPQIIFKLIK